MIPNDTAGYKSVKERRILGIYFQRTPFSISLVTLAFSDRAQISVPSLSESQN